MSERKNPETSIAAYKSLDVTQLTQMYKDIISALTVIGEGTFEDVAAHLKVDKARVWKRMSELERMELVYRPGNKRVLKSGRSGFTWMLRIAATPKVEKATERSPKGESVGDFSKKIVQISKSVQLEVF